ncbi:MAG TPA: LysR family transcriptional regulator [Chloroflexi bacterium]|jgi:enamine deaminase RidA (YjgF/YER057c/UK114 family)|nr:LysR family transcriptional regulator [Chloroflexota bacterium]
MTKDTPTIVERLAELGYHYTPLPVVAANPVYHNATRIGDLVFTAGQGPILNEVMVTGQVGTGAGDLDVESAQDAAALAAFNCLCAVGAVADIESVKRVLKVTGLVNVADGFTDAPTVMNGCSNLLNKIFGDSGHARSATGAVLWNNLAVEIEMVVALA